MNYSKISVRYARALLGSAKDQGKMDQVRKDMEIFLSILSEVPQLKEMLESPVIAGEKKRNVLEQIFKDTMQPLTISFFNLALDKSREAFLPGMARMYIELYKIEKGIVIESVTTVVSIDKNIRENLIRVIRNSFRADVELTEKLNNNLIGGFVLQVEDQQLDASVAGQLKKIKRQLIETSLRKK